MGIVLVALIGGLYVFWPRKSEAYTNEYGEKEYEDEGYCAICGEWTPQTIHPSSHERDSSDEWKVCHKCGGTYSGYDGYWEPKKKDDEMAS